MTSDVRAADPEALEWQPVVVDGARSGRSSNVRTLLSLGVVFFAVGIANAVVMPFLSLFLSTAVHADPVRITLFLLVAPLSGVVVATLIGWLSDRWPIRRALLVGASLAGLINAALTAFIRDYWILVTLAVTLAPLAMALFPQAFAYARQVLAGTGRAAMGISTLRTVFSLSWVVGPPLAALLLSTGGFRFLYGTAAIMFALAALVSIVGLRQVATPTAATDGHPTDAPAASRSTLLLTAAAFIMLSCPLTLGVQALPLFISADLGGDAAQAGLILGLCAALEIPMMLALGVLGTRIRVRVLLLAGAACGVVYYAVASVATSFATLAVGQLANAAFIAAVSGIAISYVQDLLPQHPGQATTLFTNCHPIGAMLAGPLFGLAQHYGFRLAYGVSAALCAAGLLLLLVVRPSATPRVATAYAGGSAHSPARTG
ncbi:sugar efflux transporter [Micromonospora narathiwatensis]|uniref:MFS transporter, SET family, sugar efflux transporter n=1 Tax=Micromonospora narathiwatensis TaxID=299146 RepID=A0A1A8ZPD2_9ACTN|nr:sugar efflux transporter [Micromonospora narathiwatensis]SBT45968.1 MFS transporter, SET family, sugar efflux transporter [Micromonospora narathiwatensis]